MVAGIARVMARTVKTNSTVLATCVRSGAIRQSIAGAHLNLRQVATVARRLNHSCFKVLALPLITIPSPSALTSSNVALGPSIIDCPP